MSEMYMHTFSEIGNRKQKFNFFMAILGILFGFYCTLFVLTSNSQMIIFNDPEAVTF